jgi:membrane protein implicated in regulation of membrane protease activity
MITVYWLVGAALLLLLELLTVSLTTIWFAGGAVVAAIVSVFCNSIIIQTVAFIIVSVILLLITRPIAMNYINAKVEKTNADALVGRRCKVAETIDPDAASGKIIINGIEWSARPVDGSSIIAKGEEVVIKEISGVRLMVEQLD